MIKEIDLAGMYVAPMLGYLVAAFALTGIMLFLLRRTGFYRWVWHPPLFNFSLLVIVLTGLVVWTM